MSLPKSDLVLFFNTTQIQNYYLSLFGPIILSCVRKSYFWRKFGSIILNVEDRCYFRSFFAAQFVHAYVMFSPLQSSPFIYECYFLVNCMLVTFPYLFKNGLLHLSHTKRIPTFCSTNFGPIILPRVRKNYFWHILGSIILHAKDRCYFRYFFAPTLAQISDTPRFLQISFLINACFKLANCREDIISRIIMFITIRYIEIKPLQSSTVKFCNGPV